MYLHIHVLLLPEGYHVYKEKTEILTEKYKILM